MRQNDRKQHWEQVYRDKDAHELSWYQREPRLSLELIQATQTAADAPVIDVGGGASTLVDALLAAGFADLSVLDISGQALDAARARLGAAAQAVTWIEADITTFRPPRQYRVWHDRAVFHFLTSASDRAAYRAALTAGLAPGGHLIIAAFGPDGPEKCSGLPVRRYDARRLHAAVGEAFNLVETREEAHHTPAGGVQAFRFYRLRRTQGSG